MNAPIKTHLDELIEKRQQISDHLEAFVQEADFDPESEEFRNLQQDAEKLEKQIEAIKKSIDLRNSSDSLAHRFGTKPVVTQANSTDDLGNQLIKSERFQQWKRSGGSGRANLMEINMRALISTSAIAPEKDRIYAGAPAQQQSLLNVINKQQVSSGSVEVVTYPAADPVAGVVVEGAQKPEATFTFSVSTQTLETIAHWVEATRQILEDEARLKDFLSNSLLRGVYDKAESLASTVVSGGNYATATQDSMLHAIRHAIAMVNDAGYRPTGVLLNPLDAADLDFEIWSGTSGGGGYGSVWGVPVIPNGAVASGSAYVADFNTAFHHYYRASADLFVTDSDVGIVATAPVSNFKRNVLTFLAEYRCKTVLVRPEAVAEAVKGTPVVESASRSGIGSTARKSPSSKE